MALSSLERMVLTKMDMMCFQMMENKFVTDLNMRLHHPPRENKLVSLEEQTAQT
jgi:hypothetical protein